MLAVPFGSARGPLAHFHAPLSAAPPSFIHKPQPWIETVSRLAIKIEDSSTLFFLIVMG